MQAGDNLVLVDGSSLAFRSFFALFKSGLRRQDGVPTWAVYGFFNSFFDFIERKKPDGVAMCFDLAEPTFRHEASADYKANRSAMPDDLAVQWPIIRQGVELLGIPLYEMAGFEADDVIGTVAKLAEARGIQVQILTGDKDAFQLVDNELRSIKVLMPGRPGKGEILEYGRAEVFEKLGVWPEQVIDYKGLCGDASDNIPGVKGIGPVTAVGLLTEYGNIEGIYENLEKIKSKSVKQKLIDGKESAFHSKMLATIVLDVPLEFDFDHCQLSLPSVAAVTKFFTDLEFKNLVGRLNKILPRFNPSEEVSSEPASNLVSERSPESKRAEIGFETATDAELSGEFNAAVTGHDLAVPLELAALKATATLAPLTTAIAKEPLIKIAAFHEPTIVTTSEQLKNLIAKIKEQSAFSIELETATGYAFDTEILGFSLAYSNGLHFVAGQDGQFGDLQMSESYTPENWQIETAYIPIKQEGGLNTDGLNQSDALALLKPLFEDSSIGKIVQECKFKMNVFAASGIELKPVVFDPVLASYLVNPADKHSLKDQAERLLGYSTVRATESAGVSKKQLTINFAQVDKVASCAADDARITLELTRYYLETLDVDQKYLLNEMELPLAAVLAKMEQTGVSLDLNYLAELSTELTRELTRLELEIFGLANHSFNINSTQQLQKVLFEELGLKSKGKTKTGLSTDSSVLEALSTEHEIVPKILEYRQLSKLRSTYVDALPPQVLASSGRLHGEFNQTTTSTGRLSSSNPNLQNIPIKTEFGRRIRRAFVPAKEDFVLLSADYSQIELRMLAHMSADEILIDAFEKNQDIHARTSGEIFDTPVEQVTSDMRRIGKTLNFALVYQQGAFATARGLGITNKEAQVFIDKYFTRYPKVKGFMTKTVDEAKETGYVSTLWGRKRHFRFLNDRSDAVRKADERAACNAPIQGSAADLMKLAMIRLDQELTKANVKAKLILQVHDELVLEVPKDEIEIVTELVKKSMQYDQPLIVPLRVDIGTGPNWMDAK